MIQQTSLDAYDYVDLNRCESQVLKVLLVNKGICNKEIAIQLGWEINRVTGRVKSLRDKGLVEQDKFKVYNGRTVMAWRTKNGIESTSNKRTSQEIRQTEARS